MNFDLLAWYNVKFNVINDCVYDDDYTPSAIGKTRFQTIPNRVSISIVPFPSLNPTSVPQTAHFNSQ